MICKECNTGMQDFSFIAPLVGKTSKKYVHYICPKCGSHLFKKKWFTKAEWNSFMND